MKTLRLFPLTLIVTFALYCPQRGAAENELTVLKSRIKELEAELAKRPKDPSSYPVPNTLKFCGDEIEFKAGDSKKRLELEIIKIVKNRFQVQLYINRATSVFPVIEEIAKEEKTCPDLKFLAVVESALKAKVVSRAKATGWWQFMPATAKGFKLKVTPELDERSDLRSSTRAALRYLKKLYKRFDSWPLAMAGYNTGPNRLKRSSKKQKRDSFWDLDLYTEAERYSPRVLAMYHVLTHLKEYDFGRTLQDGWAQEPQEVFRLFLKSSKFKKVKYVTQKVKVKIKDKKRRGKKRKKARTIIKKVKKKVVTIDQRIKFNPLALYLDVPLRDLQRFNPHLIGKHLPLDTSFNLYLPPGRMEELKKALLLDKVDLVYENQAAKDLKKQGKEVARSATYKPIELNKESTLSELINQLGGPIEGTYTVQVGDQLWQIATRAQISVEQLKKLNGLNALSILKVGQQLHLQLD